MGLELCRCELDLSCVGVTFSFSLLLPVPIVSNVCTLHAKPIRIVFLNDILKYKNGTAFSSVISNTLAPRSVINGLEVTIEITGIFVAR